MRRHSFAALGTECLILFVCPEPTRAAVFTAAAQRWTLAFEAKYSRFRPDSLVGRINAAAGKTAVELDEEAAQLFDLAGQLTQLTGGILDATALPLLRLWNYRSASPRLPSDTEIEAARRLVGWNKVHRSPGRLFLPEPGMGLDLGGFGKEYAVDAVIEIARAHGIERALVDFGHDVRVLGHPDDGPWWRIGVEDPDAPGQSWATLGLTNRAIATSGDYIRGFTINGRRYGHILDLRTGLPVANGCRSVTVVAGSCLEAGTLSTTAFVQGPGEGLRLIESSFGAEGCLRTVNATLQSRGFFALRCDQA
ncbi:MAG: FAD:protein FMN transferase [Opitutaceae bacterium]|nr:FAD:protein FMN transferase [Opitutaceae bacterium]